MLICEIPEFKLCNTNHYDSCRIAGFFLWIDLSKCLDPTIIADQGGWAAESDISRRLLQIGVKMSSGYAYHNEVPGWFRIIFSVEVETLKEGLSRYVLVCGVFIN